MLCISALAISLPTFGQQRIYLDQEGREVDSTAEFYRCLELNIQPDSRTYVKEFDDENHLRNEGAYSVFNDSVRTREGLHKYYRWANGELWYTETYESGTLQQLESYYPGGALKRQETFKDGEFRKGKCFNEDGSRRTFTHFNNEPQFPGGLDALMRFLGENIQYPATARENDIQGVVVMTFVVDKDGSVITPVVVRDIGGGSGAEALRVVKLMPKWRPGIIDDEPVKVRYTLPVRFRLE